MSQLEKTLKLLELFNIDIMYQEEHKKYFFEWIIDDKKKTIWINEYI